MNTVQLIGRLTKDPELRLTDGGTAVCTIRLAVPRRKRNGKEPPPNYIDVVTFAAHAEAIAEHMPRVAGWPLGRLDHQEWDHEGDRRYL